MEDQEKNKVQGYSLYIFTFIALTVLTLLAVWLTQVRLNTPVLITLILLIATLQAAIVLFFNMHLKFHDRILIMFVSIIFSLIFFVIITTMLDYVNR